jgi:predicted esterase
MFYFVSDNGLEGSSVSVAGSRIVTALRTYIAPKTNYTERLRQIVGILSRRERPTGGDDALVATKTVAFLGHCEDDEVVPINNEKALCDGLRELGMSVDWHAYS